MLTLFGHAGEEHADLAASSTHLLEEWYVAIPLFFLVIALVAYLAWLVSNGNRHLTLGVVTFLLLIIGFTTFTISPIVSVLAILIGLGCSLFAAFTSIIS